MQTEKASILRITTMRNKDYKNRVRGYQNKKRGDTFEKIIMDACRYYENNGYAFIEKTPEPFHILKSCDNGKHFVCNAEKRGQPDFKGTLNNGGQAICFEAKSTSSDKMHADRVKPNQADSLDKHEKLGAVVFILVCFNGLHYYRVPWSKWKTMKEWNGRKYITKEDIERYAVKWNSQFCFLDFLGIYTPITRRQLNRGCN